MTPVIHSSNLFVNRRQRHQYEYQQRQFPKRRGRVRPWLAGSIYQRSQDGLRSGHNDPL